MSEQEKGNLKIQDTMTSIPQLLMQLNGGELANVLGAMFSQVGGAVARTDRAGEINVKFKFKPGSSADNSHLDVSVVMDAKEPKMHIGFKREDVHKGAIVFVGPGGKLTYDRPKEDNNGQLQLATETEEQVKMREVR